jgi:hypothetical protein
MGDVIQSLFGVATESQLAVIKTAVDETRDKQQDIIIHYNNLIAIVNQTTHIATENRELLQNFSSAVGLLYNTMSSLDAIRMRMEMEERLRVLELMRAAIHRLAEDYLNKRYALEQGRLTEDLLPPHVLRELEHKDYRQIDPINWYYQNVKVYPLWKDGEHLTFVAIIPLVEEDNWSLFKIRTFPVPTEDGTGVVRLLSQKQVAVNSATGTTIAVTEDCYGSPLLCPPGPRWRIESCAATLLKIGRQSPHEVCSVSLKTVDENRRRSSIYVIDLNEIVVCAWAEQLLVRCPSDSVPKQVQLERGCHNLVMNPKCKIEGESWSIDGIMVWETSQTLDSRKFIIPPELNLSLISAEERPAKWIGLGNVSPVEFATLPDTIVPLSRAFRSPDRGWWSWLWQNWLLFLLIIPIIVITIIIVRFYPRKELEGHHEGKADIVDPPKPHFISVSLPANLHSTMTKAEIEAEPIPAEV